MFLTESKLDRFEILSFETDDVHKEAYIQLRGLTPKVFPARKNLMKMKMGVEMLNLNSFTNGTANQILYLVVRNM